MSDDVGRHVTVGRPKSCRYAEFPMLETCFSQLLISAVKT